MLVIGLTGGMGSGKTTVAELFAKKWQTPIIDADIIARDLTQANQLAFNKILEHFGSTILNDNQALNRKKLREIIFNNPEERHWLEALLHPLINEKIQAEIKNIKADYCIVVIPLLLEKGPFPFIDRVLVVDADPEIQISRVATRDQLTRQEILAILNTQLSRQQRLTKAHGIIHNDGNLEQLSEQIDILHHHYLTMANSG